MSWPTPFGAAAGSAATFAGTFANRPTSAAIGARAVFTDLNNAVFIYDGTKWIPNGAQIIFKQRGTTLAPASAALNNGNTIVGVNKFIMNDGDITLPANLLYRGAKLRLAVAFHRTGAVGSLTAICKIGTAGTSSDTTVLQLGYSTTDNSGIRHFVDMVIGTDDKLECTSLEGFATTGAGSNHQLPAAGLAITYSSSYKITHYLTTQPSAGDVGYVRDAHLEMLP